jgi:predicted GNAT family acetyltransferase/glutaredoxin
MLTLYQAEWCPFSSAVREVLTELGLDVVLKQVEPWPEQRAELRRVSGGDQIPTLQAEDGSFHRGTREIFAHLRTLHPWPFAAGHRRRFADHADARESDVAGQLIEYFRGTDELETAQGEPAEAVVTDNPDASRYELRLNGRLIGLAAYRRRPGRVTITHTEVDEACSGRGFGSMLARAVLDDARARGERVLPLCPFIAGYIERHPEYRDLLATPAHA